MATVEEGIQSQIRNIEAKFGKSMAEWGGIVKASGLAKHGQVVSLLKEKHGLNHAAAHRIALTVLRSDGASVAKAIQAAGGDPIDTLYEGTKAPLKPIHDKIVAAVTSLGPDVEFAPKKGYVSLRRRKQFAMIQPSTRTRIDVGLVLHDEDAGGRLESATGFNALFTHRVRVTSLDEVDKRLVAWLRSAYDAAK